MSPDPAGREAGAGRSEWPTEARAGLAAAFVANTVDDGPPGLEPTLGSLRRALDEIEAALAATGAVRAALTDLAAGAPGDDRVLLSFLRSRLTGPDARLLEILSGISEEHRALLRAEAEILAIYQRPSREPVLALERLAAATAEFREQPIARYVTPSRPEPARGRRGEADRRDDRGRGDGADRQRGSALGWLGGLLRPGAATRSTDAGSADWPEETPPGARWTTVAGPVAPAAPDVAEEAATATIAEQAGESAAASVDVASDEPVALPPFLEPAAAVPDPTPTEELTLDPEAVEAVEEAAEGTRSSALALPTATGPYGARSSRPRTRRPAARSAGAGGRRIAGLGLAIVIPALAAMWVGGVQQGGAVVGDDSGVAAATSPTTLEPAASLIPISIKDDPDIIPLGDDHPAGGAPAGSQAPAAPSGLPAIQEPATAPGITLAYRGPSDRKVIALTFDDGYAPANVRAIYDLLVREKVKATFFVNGYYLSRDPEIWKRIADAGFPVGNHTYYHVDIRGLDAAGIKQELRMTSSAWRRVTGGRMIPYFRPPYGARTTETDAAIAAAGYKHVVMWDTTSADTVPGITDATALASALSGGPGSIVLLHAGPDVTPRILQAVIDGYRDRGFEFVTIPELLGP